MLSSCNYPSFQTRSFSNKPPGILFLRPDISLQTKAKRPDTTNVFRNLLNDSRIENEIKKKEREKRKWKKKKEEKSARRKSTNRRNQTPPPSPPLVSRVQVLSMIPRRRSTTDYRVPLLLLLLLEGRENKLVNDFTRDEFTRQIVQDNAHLSTLDVQLRCT